MIQLQETELTPRQKKLLFRAWHRGTREMDLMFGRFAQISIPGFDELHLDLFEELMDESDPDVFDWITGKTPLPILPIRPMLEQMMHFYQIEANVR